MRRLAEWVERCVFRMSRVLDRWPWLVLLLAFAAGVFVYLDALGATFAASVVVTALVVVIVASVIVDAIWRTRTGPDRPDDDRGTA